MYHIGQKIVCVDASPSDHPLVEHALVRGATYTIAGFDLETKPGTAGILIEEWQHPRSLWHNGLLGFRPDRFRPIVERKTSIEVFEKILKPEKVDA